MSILFKTLQSCAISTEAKRAVAFVCSLQSAPKVRHLDRSKTRRRFCLFSPKRPPKVHHLDRSKTRRRFCLFSPKRPRSASSRPKQNAPSLLPVLSKAPPKCVISTEAKRAVAFACSLQSAPKMRHLDRSKTRRRFACSLQSAPKVRHLDRSKTRRRFCLFSPKRPQSASSRPKQNAPSLLPVLSKAPPKMRHLDRSSGLSHRLLRSGETPAFAFVFSVCHPRRHLLLFVGSLSFAVALLVVILPRSGRICVCFCLCFCFRP